MAEGLCRSGRGAGAERLRSASAWQRRPSTIRGSRVTRSTRPVFDVTDEAAVISAFRRFDDEGIAIDILVNNAGIQLRKPIVELSTAEWQQRDRHQPDQRLYRRPRSGAADDQARQGRQGHQHRLADQRGRPRHRRALHGREGRHQDADPGHGRRMGRARHPGQRDRAGLHADRHEPGAGREPRVRCLGQGTHAGTRWGKPEELVGAAVFLASAASDYVNGQIIYVDGGMLAVL